MGAFISAGLDLLSGIASRNEEHYSNQIMAENYRTQNKIASDNLKFQREAYDYQKSLNATQMAREDSSYQRKVNDLKLAGLNPALALGGGSPSSALRAGSAPQQEAFERKYIPLDYKEQGGLVQRLMAYRMQERDYSMSLSQQALTDAQVITQKANAIKALSEADLTQYLKSQYSKTGMTPADSVVNKTIAGAFRQIGDTWNWLINPDIPLDKKINLPKDTVKKMRSGK